MGGAGARRAGAAVVEPEKRQCSERKCGDHLGHVAARHPDVEQTAGAEIGHLGEGFGAARRKPVP